MNVYVLSQGRVLAETVRQPLHAAGHEVSLFADVDACVAACRKELPRALVMPRRIGGADACDVLEAVRAHDPARAMSVVLVSPDQADRAPARQWGVAFLPVPFQPHELLDVVGAVTRARKLILLADDSALIHKHTVPILEEAGFDVVSAHDGEEALRLCDERAPDLVITDVEMPKVDGYQVCKAIKESQRPSPIPVIICSALGEAQQLERGFDAGADDYLVKPAVPDELVSRIRALISTFGLESGARERILVADDSPAVRHLIADSLVRQGFAVVTAGDGREALELALGTRFDMVITDYDMPRMTGFELVHALKRDPKTRELPTMMLTARDTRRDQAQMRAAGLTSYLVKPFSVDKCVAMVERVLAEKRLLAYKEASRLYISDGGVRAAERAAQDRSQVRAEEREMTILFSDICGFTSMSSSKPPAEVVHLLNGFFDVMCPILKSESADIDKFIGDAIMALFDDVGEADAAPLRAVRAALAMQEGLAAWNRENQRAVPGWHDMAIRVGINVGRVVRGDIGSRHVRRDYTVIGDVVNRAQRFESAAPHGGILVGERTYQATRDHFLYEPRPGLILKGVKEPVNAYVVVGKRIGEPGMPAK
jgi:DNA-binding response OmpR family regulator